MLRSLTVRNFAIIERLDIEFGGGFNVLTGETGAGKSIIMAALSLILGGRGGAESVRTGADRASIDATFELAGSPALQSLISGLGFDLEEETLLISREISASGKSACRISGRPATVSQLKEIGDYLVDLHGQHEHQSLLSVSRHMDLLDDWGGASIVALREAAALAWQKAHALRREREALETDARERVRLVDLYQFQVKEIDEAKLTAGEDERLEQDYRRVSNAQKLVEEVNAASEALSSEERSGALGALAMALRSLESAAALDGSLSAAVASVQSAIYELSEVERDLGHYADSLELEPERVTEMEERMDLLRALKRKYGDTLDEVLEYRAETSAKLNGLLHGEERAASLDREIASAEAALKRACAELTAERVRSAREFEAVTVAELRDLALEKSQFKVSIEPGPPSQRGADRVEFLISTNPGEPLRPLVRVASGGEISRVMLAIKTALARQEPLPTMVFDEIDVGVGGRTAGAIAAKMGVLAQSAQILCITHLAQLAGRASSHYLIRKDAGKDRTSVTVIPLRGQERVEEIARMLGGDETSGAVIQHAREMLAAGREGGEQELAAHAGA